MNNLIPVNYDGEKQTVLARGLSEFLEVETPFRLWFPRMCEYGFLEGLDFTPYIFVHPQNKQETTDYQLTIEMAKEISMLQRTEKGKQARQYFIQLEKAWNSPEKIMARALQIADKQIQGLQLQGMQKDQIINELRPKATYYDLILQNKSLLSVTKISKDYGFSAIALNQILHEEKVQFKQGDCWLLYQDYADRGYTQSKTQVIDEERSKLHTYWTQKGRLFIYDLLKNKRGILPIIERRSEQSCAIV